MPSYISRYGGFCAHDDNDDNDTTNYFTPCAYARGENITGRGDCDSCLPKHELSYTCLLQDRTEFL